MFSFKSVWLALCFLALSPATWAEADERTLRLESLAADESQPARSRAQAWQALAEGYSHQGNLNEAYRSLLQALELDPGLYASWERMGDIHLDLAMQAYGRAVKGQPTARLDKVLRQVRSLLASAAPLGAKGDTAAANAAVLTALEQWRSAWQARDAQAYLAMYATTFKPQGGGELSQWRDQRIKRLEAATSVSVALDNVTVAPRGKSSVIQARFTEHLRADEFSRDQRKVLEWVREGDAWRIVREAVESP